MVIERDWNCYAYILYFNLTSEIKEIAIPWHLFNVTVISEQWWQINGDKYLYLETCTIFVTLLLPVEVGLQAPLFMRKSQIM